MQRVEGREEAAVWGIILAGTYHWGPSPFERILRGPLLPVAQVPLICYPLQWLREGGVRCATICANSSTHAVRDYLGGGDRLAMHLEYYEDHAPRGAAGCVRDAGSGVAADTFVIVEGALIPSVNIRELLRTHRQSGAAITALVEIDRRRNGMAGEQPRIPGGVYVFDRRTFDAIPANGFQDIKEGLLERLHQAGERVVAHEVAGVAPRVLNFATYTAVNRWAIERTLREPCVLEGYVRTGDALRHPTAHIDPRARLVGPVLIGPRSRIMERAVIVGPTTIGADCQIGAGALVSRSALWDRCAVAPGAMVDNSVLADEAALEQDEMLAGTVKLPSVSGGWSALTALPEHVLRPPVPPSKLLRMARGTRRLASLAVSLPIGRSSGEAV